MESDCVLHFLPFFFSFFWFSTRSPHTTLDVRLIPNRGTEPAASPREFAPGGIRIRGLTLNASIPPQEPSGGQATVYSLSSSSVSV